MIGVNEMGDDARLLKTLLELVSVIKEIVNELYIGYNFNAEVGLNTLSVISLTEKLDKISTVLEKLK